MARKKIRSATDQRKFTLVYNDFLESDLLDKHEKLIFIAIKKFADNDTLKAYPSLQTLHRMTGISIRWIKKSIEHMEQLGVIGVEHRSNETKGHQSNIYTLYDYAEVWNVGSSDDIKEVADEISEMKLVAELKARGYTVIKEKGLDNEPTKAHYQAPDINQINKNNDTMDLLKSQERFNMAQIKTLYDYHLLVCDYPERKQEFDTVMNILYDVLNTSKETIRISGEDKPSMIVISKLLKLNKDCILYSIEKFNEQTDRVKNPIGYMLTILYRSAEQYELDIQNQVRHDMSNWNPEA